MIRRLLDRFRRPRAARFELDIDQRLSELSQALNAYFEESRWPVEGRTGRREVHGSTVPEFAETRRRFAELVRAEWPDQT